MFSVTYEKLKEEPTTPERRKDSYQFKFSEEKQEPLISSVLKNKEDLFKPSEKSKAHFAENKKLLNKTTLQLRELVDHKFYLENDPDHFFKETFLNNLNAKQIQTINLKFYLELTHDNEERSKNDKQKNYIKKYIDWYLTKDQSDFMMNELQNEVHFLCQKVCFHPTEPFIAQACYDKSLMIWNYESFQPVHYPLKIHHSDISALCFSKDGSKIASIDKNQMCIVWDLRDYSKSDLIQIDGIKEPIKTMAFSPDGSKLGLGSKDGNLMVYDFKLSKMIIPATSGHEQRIRTLEFSPDGNKIATGGQDKLIIIWDLIRLEKEWEVERGRSKKSASQDLQYCQKLKGHRNEVFVVKFNLLGDRLMSGGRDKNILVWDVLKGQELFDPMKGHKNVISALAISPDGVKFASGSNDRTIIIWDSAVGTIALGPLEGHENPIIDLKYSEDAMQLFSISTDNMIIVWNAVKGEIITKPIESYPLNSWVHAITPDGLTVVVAKGKKDDNDGTFSVWNALTAQPVSSCVQAHKAAIKVMACSPNNKLLVTGGRDKKIVVWNLENPHEVLYGPFEGHTEEITAIAYSSDNKTFAAGTKNAEIRVWDTFKGAPSAHDYEGHKDKITALTFCREGKFLASGGNDCKVLLWNVIHGKILRKYEHESHVSCIAFSPNSKFAASASEDGKVKIVEIEPPADQDEAPPVVVKCHMQAISAIVWAHDNRKIATASLSPIEIKIWEIGMMKTVKLFIGPLYGHFTPVYSLMFSEDDGHFLSTSADCTKNWKITCVNSVKVYPIENAFDVSFDGSRIVAPGEKNTDLFVIDSHTGDKLLHINRSHLYKVNFAYFSNDSMKIVTGSDDCSLMVWDTNTGIPIIGPLKGHIAPVRVGVFSHNDYKLASSGADKNVIIWDAQTGKPLFPPLSGHIDDVFTLEFSYDEQRLVSGGDDGRIIIWDVLKGELLVEITEAHEDWVTCVKFVKEGTRVISSSFDTKIKVWNAENGELMTTLANHTQSVYSIKLSPDQGKLLSASNDHKSIMFDLIADKSSAQEAQSPYAELVSSPRIDSPGLYDRSPGLDAVLSPSLGGKSTSNILGLKGGDFHRERLFNIGVKGVHWSRNNDIFYVFDEEIQCNFNYFANEAVFFSKGLILSEFYRNPDKFSDQEFMMIVNGNLGEIMPFYYTFMHIVAYTDDHQRFFQNRILKLVKIKQQMIDFSAFFKKDIHDMSCVEIILKKNNKSLIQIIFRYMAKNYYPSQLFSQGFVDKITVKLLNQIMDIFGEDTSLIMKILDMCLDVPLEYPEHFVHIGFRKDFYRTLENKEKKDGQSEVKPRMTTHQLEDFIRQKEEEENGFFQKILGMGESAFKTQEIIGARVLYLKDILSLDGGDALDFFKSISNLESDNPIFGNETLQKIIHYKWDQYAKMEFFKEAAWFLALQLLYIGNASYLLVLRQGEDHQDYYDSLALVLDFFIFCFNFRYAYRELSQARAFGVYEYLISIWNLLDITLIGSIIVSVAYDVLSAVHFYTDFETLKVIHAYIIFLQFVRLLSYARGIKGTSFMIRLILQVIIDIRSFLFLVLSFILALAYSTCMLQTTLTSDHFSTFDTFFRAMLGDLSEFDELEVDFFYALWVFFFIASIVLCIVLLNLLIAIISDTFGAVKANEELARHYEMVNIIYSIDAEIKQEKEVRYYAYIHAEVGHLETLTSLEVLKNKVSESTEMIKNIDYHLEMLTKKDGNMAYRSKLPEKRKKRF